jgi:hypothetical protein
MQLVIALLLVEVLHLALVLLAQVVQLARRFVVRHPLLAELAVVLRLGHPVLRHDGCGGVGE